MKFFCALCTAVILSINFNAQTQLNWKVQVNEPNVTLLEVEDTFWQEYESLSEENKAKELKEFNRFKYLWFNRVQNNITGTSEFGLYKNVLDDFVDSEQYCQDDLSNWNLMGPTSFSTLQMGRVTAIWADSEDPDIIICGSDEGSGIWRSADGGQTWNCVTDNLKLPGLGIIDIVSKPDNSAILIAACGNSNLLRSTYSPGLLISLNKGQTWSRLNSFDNNISELINNFAFSEVDPDILYAIGDHIIYKYNFELDSDPIESPNPVAWDQYNIQVGIVNYSEMDNLLFTDVETILSPLNEDIIFISSKVSGTIGSDNYAVILKSTDGAISWTNENQELPSRNLNRIINGEFDLYNEVTLKPNNWDSYNWKTYNISGNNVAGSFDPYYLFNGSSGNRIAPPEVAANIEKEADYYLCLDYHNAENCALKVLVVHKVMNAYWRFSYEIFNTGFSESQANGLCFDLYGLYEEAYQAFVQNYIGTNTMEEIEEWADNGTWELLVTSEAISPYLLVDDQDFADLTWIDDVIFEKTSFSYPGRIQISSSTNNYLYSFLGDPKDEFAGQAIDRYSANNNEFEFIYKRSGFNKNLGGGFFNSLFEVSPMEPAFIYWGGVNLCKYDGATGVNYDMIEIGTGLHIDFRDVYFTVDENIVSGYIGTDGGPALSVDNGENWSLLLGDGLAVTQLYGFGVSNTGKEYIGGTLDNSLSCGKSGESYIISSNDGGRVAMRNDLISNPILYSWSNEDVQKVLFNEGDFLIDLEEEFTSIKIPGGYNQFLDREIVYHPAIDRVYVGKDHLYYYEPNFQNNYFVEITVPGSQELINGERPYRTDFNSIAVSESDPQVMYIADEGPCWLSDIGDIRLKVFKTEDGGQSWLDLTSSEVDNLVSGENLLRKAYKSLAVRDILVSPVNADHIWVCFPGVCTVDVQGNSTNRVLKSLDGGISWTDISQGLPPLPMHNMAFQRNANNRVYIGTDVGVYYIDDYSSGWQCFTSTLPACVVTGLQIDECRGKIYCCTFGRGIWESDLLPGNEMHINTEVVWTENKVLDGGIVIEPSGSLEIVNSTVTLPGNSRIYVDLDAELILDQAILQPSECNSRWKGIELGGSNDQYQVTSEQGKVVAFNNSIIKGAKIGISNINSDDGASSGGIALLEEVSFEDCLIGVKLHDYPAYGLYNEFSDVPNNLCNISKCSFSWGPEMYNYSFIGSEPMDSYPTGVYLSLVKGVQVKGNLFYNSVTDPSIPIEKMRGTGIHVNTASMKCHAIEEDNGNGGVDLIYNQFTGLTKGIYSVTFDPLYTTSIDGSRFDLCWRSVSLEGQFSPRVTRCEFEIPYGWEYLASQVPYGLSIKECQYYEVEDNLFSTDAVSDYVFQVGIVVKDSYDEDEQQASNYTIYRNDFTNLKIGISVEGENSSAVGNNGLQIKCNRFFQTAGLNDERCISLSKPGTSIAPIQGSPATASSPAGNVFTPAQNEYNFFINQGASPLDIYWHHSPSLVDKVVPFPASNGLNPWNTDFDYVYNDVCQSDLSVLVQSPTQNLSELNQHYSNFREIKGIYDGIVDKGNQQILISFIRDPLNTSIEVRNEMLSSLPNSDAALREAMYRTGGMNPWHMSQVLIANSPLKTTIINYMQQSGLDNFYQELVLGQQNGGVSYKSILEADMEYYTSLLSNTKADIMRSIMLGDVLFTSALFDSLLTDTMDVVLSRLAMSSLMYGDPLSIELDVLDDCSAGNTIDNYCKVQNILLNLHIEERNISQLEQSEIYVLESVVQDGISGSAIAEAILEIYSGEVNEEEVAWPSQSRGIGMFVGSDMRKTDQNEILSIYPNPTNDIAYFVLKGDNDLDNMSIAVMDLNNNLVKEFSNLSNTNLIVEVSMKGLSSGVYNVQLNWNGFQIQVKKLVVVK